MRCTPPIRAIHTPAATLRSAPLEVLVALVALFSPDDPGSDCGPGLNDGAEEFWGGWDYVTTTCAW